MNFFDVSPIEADEFGIVRAPDDFELPWFEQAQARREWSPIRLTLHEGGFADAHGGNLTRVVYSELFRGIVESHKAAEDSIEWMKFEVAANGETRDYYVPVFPDCPDILHREKSIFAGDFVVKPVIDSRKVGTRQVLAFDPNSDRFFVSDKIRQALILAGCRGVEFSKVAMR